MLYIKARLIRNGRKGKRERAKKAKARSIEIVSIEGKINIDGSDFRRPTSDLGKSRFLASLEMTKGCIPEGCWARMMGGCWIWRIC
jgi:hypothetical protein